MIHSFLSKNRASRLRIAVLGDCMIDRYCYGRVSRVSPEFPVQVLHSEYASGDLFPGGSANVCQQMIHFNVDPVLIGFCDGDAKRLFNTNYCVELDKGNIPLKTRFYDGDFPLLRWDIEASDYGENQGTLEELRRTARYNFHTLNEQPLNAVILSDYNKGFWSDELAQNIINECNEKGIITIVDPKKALDRWKNCKIFKPNSAEAEALSGHSDWKGQADYLQERLGCESVVITQSGKGVVGKHKDKHFSHMTPHKLSSKEVNSCIGAGDCFVAILSIALSHGLSLQESCQISFEAGVQYVKARHNKPITPYQIHSGFDKAEAKIIGLDELCYLKDRVFSQEEFSFTNGCFDGGLHKGHLSTLKFAKSKGDRLVVGLNGDRSVRKLKGDQRPICSFDERASLLAALEYVDFVVEFNEDTPLDLVKRLKPQFLVKGMDYSNKDIAGQDYVKEVFLAPILEGYSTTGFLRKLGLIQK